MARPTRASLAILALPIFVAVGAVAAQAQSRPPLPAMPMPPSASDPAPREGARSQQRKPAAQKKRTEDGAEVSEPSRPRRTNNAAQSSAPVERPARYVPEEFDRGGSGDGSRAKPFMSESGRPGMGMRF